MKTCSPAQLRAMWHMDTVEKRAQVIEFYEAAIRDFQRQVEQAERLVGLWARAFKAQSTDNPGDVACRVGSRLASLKQEAQAAGEKYTAMLEVVASIEATNARLREAVRSLAHGEHSGRDFANRILSETALSPDTGRAEEKPHG